MSIGRSLTRARARWARARGVAVWRLQIRYWCPLQERLARAWARVAPVLVWIWHIVVWALFLLWFGMGSMDLGSWDAFGQGI